MSGVFLNVFAPYLVDGVALEGPPRGLGLLRVHSSRGVVLAPFHRKIEKIQGVLLQQAVHHH